MKTNYNLFKALTIVLLFSINSWSQNIIVQWNFNGIAATDVPGGVSSPTPVTGTGTAQFVGLTLPGAFASGNTTAGTLETETTTPPNYGWNSTGYPAAGTGNKTAGVQFNVSTIGHAGITFRFEQRLSNTANTTYVVQYTTDNTAANPVWVDSQTFTIVPAATGTGDTWYNSRIVDLSAITGLDNNPNVAFRVVSAFDPIAGDYLAARSTSTYAGGTVRYDMVTITSNLLGTEQFNFGDYRFTIYPNPSNKELVHLSKAQDIEVFDASGKVIYTAKNATSIDTKAFQSGVYFIKTAKGLVQKLIVK